MVAFVFLYIPQNTAKPTFVNIYHLWFNGPRAKAVIPLSSLSKKMFWILIKLYVSVEMLKTIYGFLIEANEHETNGLTTHSKKVFVIRKLNGFTLGKNWWNIENTFIFHYGREFYFEKSKISFRFRRNWRFNGQS